MKSGEMTILQKKLALTSKYTRTSCAIWVPRLIKNGDKGLKCTSSVIPTREKILSAKLMDMGGRLHTNEIRPPLLHV